MTLSKLEPPQPPERWSCEHDKTQKRLFTRLFYKKHNFKNVTPKKITISFKARLRRIGRHVAQNKEPWRQSLPLNDDAHQTRDGTVSNLAPRCKRHKKNQNKTKSDGQKPDICEERWDCGLLHIDMRNKRRWHFHHFSTTFLFLLFWGVTPLNVTTREFLVLRSDWLRASFEFFLI